MKLITKNIFKEARELSEKKYEELKATDKMMNCDALAVCHKNKSFWLTTKKTFKKINKTSKK